MKVQLGNEIQRNCGWFKALAQYCTNSLATECLPKMERFLQEWSNVPDDTQKLVGKYMNSFIFLAAKEGLVCILLSDFVTCLFNFQVEISALVKEILSVRLNVVWRQIILVQPLLWHAVLTLHKTCGESHFLFLKNGNCAQHLFGLDGFPRWGNKEVLAYYSQRNSWRLITRSQIQRKPACFE